MTGSEVSSLVCEKVTPGTADARIDTNSYLKLPRPLEQLIHNHSFLLLNLTCESRNRWLQNPQLRAPRALRIEPRARHRPAPSLMTYGDKTSAVCLGSSD